MKIRTLRFGTVDVPSESLTALPQGLIGFPTITRLAMMDLEQGGWFQWWQAVEDPAMAFVTVDPFRIMDYDLSGVESEIQALEITKPSGMIVVVLMTLHGGGLDHTTVNLLAPIIVNRASRIGRQVVLPDERYRVDQPLGAMAAKRAVEIAA